MQDLLREDASEAASLRSHWPISTSESQPFSPLQLPDRRRDTLRARRDIHSRTSDTSYRSSGPRSRARLQTPDETRSNTVAQSAEWLAERLTMEIRRDSRRALLYTYQARLEDTITATLSSAVPSSDASRNESASIRVAQEPGAPAAEHDRATRTISNHVHTLSEESTCSICLEKLLDGRTLTYCRAQCMQFFHNSCMKGWYLHSTTCPCWYVVIPSFSCLLRMCCVLQSLAVDKSARRLRRS